MSEHELNDSQKKALAAAAKDAVRVFLRYRVPSLVTLAQWAEESGWGQHAPGNNCFGIKSYAGCYGVQVLDTHEWENGEQVLKSLPFATFPTLQDCFAYRASLLTTRPQYATAWANFLKTQDPERFVRDLSPVYAPGPGTLYADHVIELMRRTDVKQADENAYARLSEPLTAP